MRDRPWHGFWFHGQWAKKSLLKRMDGLAVSPIYNDFHFRKAKKKLHYILWENVFKSDFKSIETKNLIYSAHEMLSVSSRANVISLRFIFLSTTKYITYANPYKIFICSTQRRTVFFFFFFISSSYFWDEHFHRETVLFDFCHLNLFPRDTPFMITIFTCPCGRVCGSVCLCAQFINNNFISNAESDGERARGGKS